MWHRLQAGSYKPTPRLFVATHSESLREKIRALPDGPGVYLMKDRLGRIIYVGKAKSLKKRVSTYFQAGRERALRHQPKIRTLIELIADLEILEVKSEPEALLLEGKLIKQWRPKYNTDFTDDKRFLLVRIDLEAELPRFVLTRFKKDTRSRYFGPFAHSGLLRKTLALHAPEIRRAPRRHHPQKIPPTAPGSSTMMCAPSSTAGPTSVTTAEYRERVDRSLRLPRRQEPRVARLAARGDVGARREAGIREGRRAARRRARAGADAGAHAQVHRATPSKLQTNQAALHELQAALGLESPPVHMECFDISHISGTFVVASMVHFTDGRPDKDHYRRFSIKSFIGNDDFKAMEEVVARRYRRLIEEGNNFPTSSSSTAAAARSARPSRPSSGWTARRPP
jgi:excinuclease ABC subunit C